MDAISASKGLKYACNLKSRANYLCLQSLVISNQIYLHAFTASGFLEKFHSILKKFCSIIFVIIGLFEIWILFSTRTYPRVASELTNPICPHIFHKNHLKKQSGKLEKFHSNFCEQSTKHLRSQSPVCNIKSYPSKLHKLIQNSFLMVFSGVKFSI